MSSEAESYVKELILGFQPPDCQLSSVPINRV